MNTKLRKGFDGGLNILGFPKGKEGGEKPRVVFGER